MLEAAADLPSLVRTPRGLQRLVAASPCVEIKFRAPHAIDATLSSVDGTGWFPHRNFGAHIHAMPGPANSIIVKNVPRSTNADVWDEWADEDEDDDFLSPEMRERLKALDAETAPPVDKCPIQHDLGDDDALKCSKDWVNAIVSDAGISA